MVVSPLDLMGCKVAESAFWKRFHAL